jgi:anthranilate synthase/aminodeoxychorismate synthase-like glutamine amidotransferase
MVLVLDNYDSFTYNVVQYLQVLGQEVQVVRNNEISLREVEPLYPSHIVVSPGPGLPANAGISAELVRAFIGRIPILGVCLGMQVIASVFGGQVVRAPEPVHGKTADIYHDGRALFAGIASPFVAMRYHSLVVARNSFPDCLEVSAETEDGLAMALRHRELPIVGVQFHPESILTEGGTRLLENFLKL